MSVKAKIKKKVISTLVVKYPPDDLQVLREFIQNHGAIKSIQLATGICSRTVKRVSTEGKGQVRIVMALRDHVNSVNEEISKL